MENGRIRAGSLGQVERRHAALARLRLELAGWRQEMWTLLSDGMAQGAVNWPAVRETRRHMAETMAKIRRLQP